MGYIKGEERNQVILFPETTNEYIFRKNNKNTLKAVYSIAL